ncbi:hypothetical protein EU537_01145 [Candidatus Thorarchaeota archaeon]|nr:MAG: hypothetical protein EU537_01145 [Candidatus Thorarchaeota archaeon]
MTYSILKLIELLGDQFPSLLNSVLNRIPILVVGRDSEILDDLTESLTRLSPHRHKLVFWREFTSSDEIRSVIEAEKHDHEVARTIVCCLSSTISLALERIQNFASWIMAACIRQDSYAHAMTEYQLGEIEEKVGASIRNVGTLRVESPSRIHFSLLKPSNSQLEVERRIVDIILTRKKQALERIKRLLGKSLRGLELPKGMMKAVLQLDDEAEKITQDIFEEEIKGFVYAARRAVTLLSRIRLARELGASTVLTERNLYEAIGLDYGGLNELIQFIRSEWHEDFSDCIKGGSLSGLGAWVDSMWGS